MSGTRVNLSSCVLALAVVVGCGKADPASSNDQPKARTAEEPASDPPSAEVAEPGEPAPVDPGEQAPAELRLEDRTFTIARRDQEASLRAPVPVGWRESKTSTGISFAPTTELPGIWQPQLSFEVGGYSCSGGCEDADFERERDALLERVADTLARPNRNTGKPELDELQLDVSELDKGDLAGGAFVVHRVAIPAGVEGPYFEGIQATCSRYRAGDKLYFAARVRIPRAGEQDLWPLLLDACKGAEVQ
jgi:hypothetical protein